MFLTLHDKVDKIVCECNFIEWRWCKYIIILNIMKLKMFFFAFARCWFALSNFQTLIAEKSTLAIAWKQTMFWSAVSWRTPHRSIASEIPQHTWVTSHRSDLWRTSWRDSDSFFASFFFGNWDLYLQALLFIFTHCRPLHKTNTRRAIDLLSDNILSFCIGPTTMSQLWMHSNSKLFLIASELQWQRPVI